MVKKVSCFFITQNKIVKRIKLKSYLGENNMTAFSKGLKEFGSQSLTNNGAQAYNSTGNALLDFWAVAGSMRSRKNEIVPMFHEAMGEDALLALKMAFHTRNIRGGLGERETFRIILKYLGNSYPEVVARNFHNILKFGRGDDLFALFDTNAENEMMEFVKLSLRQDLISLRDGGNISLLAKWMPSENTSSKESVNLARRFIRHLDISPKVYRQVLVKLRKRLEVVEQLLSANKWQLVKYSSVPSQAMRLYRKAFSRHDNQRFGQYLNNVEKGTEKINSSTLFPFDVFKSWISSFSIERAAKTKFDKSLQLQWNNLPNYVTDKNVLVMADTSASMNGDPMATALSLAIYFAERSKGPFKDTFITFSERPSVVQLKGKTLQDKIKCVPSIVENTDLEKAFKLILHIAIENNCKSEDMPAALVVISDMQFDSQTTRETRNWGFHSAMESKFEQAGYQLPTVVYWNVSSPTNSFQSHGTHEGLQYASGKSASTFRDICNAINMNAEEMMLQVLNSEMYQSVTL